MLATYDVGLLIGAPTAGLLVHFGQALGWPGYPTMFLGVAIVLVLTTGVYATARRQIKPRRRPRPTVPRSTDTRSPATEVALLPPEPSAAVKAVNLPPSADSGPAGGIPTQGAA
jgi:hypothetical protein